MPAKMPAKKATKKAKAKKAKYKTAIEIPLEILDIHEAAKYLRISSTRLYKMVQAGEVPAFKVAGMWRFSFASLREWVAKKEKEQAIELRKNIKKKATDRK